MTENKKKWEELNKEYIYEYMDILYRYGKIKYHKPTHTAHTSIKELLKSTTVWQNFSWVKSKEDFWENPPYEIHIKSKTEEKNKEFVIDMNIPFDDYITYNQMGGDMKLLVWGYYIKPKMERIPYPKKQ